MSKNLLIIDDEELIVKNLSMILEDLADKIFTARDGQEGINVLLQNKENIHCIICDINMPRMNGVDVIKKARKEKINIPFIFYTAHGNHELMMEAVKYGAFDFIDKPNMEGLEEIISRGLSEGFELKNKREKNPEEYISEYQKILKKIK